MRDIIENVTITKIVKDVWNFIDQTASTFLSSKKSCN